MAMKMVGTVTSNKMTNTVVVKIDQVKVHPKYQKRFKTAKKYMAETEGTAYAIGDKVEIQECRPLSKHKNWKVVKKI